MTVTTQSIPATTIEKLKEKLSNDSVRFAFKKIDGSLRMAYGTLDPKKIPVSQQPHEECSAPDKIFPYYDLEKFEWRSIQIGQLIFG